MERQPRSGFGVRRCNVALSNGYKLYATAPALIYPPGVSDWPVIANHEAIGGGPVTPLTLSIRRS
jgi:hypothetical protein